MEIKIKFSALKIQDVIILQQIRLFFTLDFVYEIDFTWNMTTIDCSHFLGIVKSDTIVTNKIYFYLTMILH